MRAKEDRRTPAPEEVPRIFDDKCIRELARTARLPRTANIARFGILVRDAALEYIRDANVASDNEVHHEVAGCCVPPIARSTLASVRTRPVRKWPSGSNDFRSGHGSS
jgi:hypothetical protein